MPQYHMFFIDFSYVMILISFERVHMSLASMSNSLEDAAEVHVSPDLCKLLVPN